MLYISKKITIPLNELEFSAIRAQGPGGQHVNKVSTAIQLRFDINRSSLAETYKKRLLKLNDRRITDDGVIIIKAKGFRSQHKNKSDAINRLVELIRRGIIIPKKRKPTQPTAASREKRLNSKTHRSQIKAHRKKITDTNTGDYSI